MRTLFLHPGDNPIHGPWTSERWDLVVDLGTAGQDSYCAWSKFFGCTVIPLDQPQPSDVRQMRSLLTGGLGSVKDDFGLDWYDLISTSYYEQVEQAFAIQRLACRLPANCDIAISRGGFDAHTLSTLLHHPVVCFSTKPRLAKLRHYVHEFSRLSLQQLVQIAGDKYDAGYQWRRHFASSPRRCSRPTILLPTNYINVTRTALDYAALLPASSFLLVSTRQSGLSQAGAPNVSVRQLAGYATGGWDEDEFRRLLVCFNTMRSKLVNQDALAAMIYDEITRSFPAFLRDGLMIRNAWLQMFHQEPISAVLCADDANHTTRIPLLLARERGLPAVACHHGALDGRYRLRAKHDSWFLAKGRMESDYLSEVCGTNRDAVEVGGAGSIPPRRCTSAKGNCIVFFSENYEAKGGRGEEFYRDLLPALSRVAGDAGRQLVVKLHPAEVISTRKRMARNVLSPDQFNLLRFVQGPLTEDLLDDTWFAVTVISTTAIDCSLRGIPIFLCTWLEYCNYGYADHMLKFGAGYRLNQACEIEDIPARLESLGQPDIAGLWQPIAPKRLESLLNENAEAVRQLATAGAS